MKNMNFIITKDEETRNVLNQYGFIEIKNQSDFYTFINEPKKMTYDISNLDISFSNKLFF